VQADAQTVPEYISLQPQLWRPTLTRLRRECRSRLRGLTETVRYGMPGYARDGTVEVGFALQRRYLALYVLNKTALDAHRRELTGLSAGKGCVRFARPDQLEWDVVGAILTDAAAGGEICP
jgi:uncharacterized protein YdhG (YjbR/CyaY superfamily)